MGRTLDQSADACKLVVECFEAISISLPCNGVDIPQSLAGKFEARGNFTFNGRRSSILSEASFNILASGLPTRLFGTTCSIRYFS